MTELLKSTDYVVDVYRMSRDKKKDRRQSQSRRYEEIGGDCI